MSTLSRKMAASSPSQAAWRGDGQPALPRLPVAILAGGLGTRLSEETATKPKPLVEIGGRPVIWHVMKHYETYGMNERSEEHTSALQSLMRNSYAVFCLKK